MRTKLKVALHYQILIALALGGFYGYFFHSVTPYTNWVGEVFLRGLNMVIVPLILTSIITGVASLGSADNLGRERSFVGKVDLDFISVFNHM